MVPLDRRAELAANGTRLSPRHTARNSPGTACRGECRRFRNPANFVEFELVEPIQRMQSSLSKPRAARKEAA